MAIAFDSVTDGGVSIGVTSKTYSHTTSGTNRIIFVSVQLPTTDKITGVTYGGVSMTLVGKVQTPSDLWSYLWVLHNPTIGVNNVVVSANASGNISSIATSYTGAKQTSTVNTSTTNATSGTTATTTVTTTVDGCWLVLGGRDNTGNAITPGTSTTERVDNVGGWYMYDSGGFRYKGTNSLILSAASQNWGIVMAAFEPENTDVINYGELVATPNTKLLLHLNGNSTDASGNGNNGTDTAITYVNGVFGQGALFNGTSSQIYSDSSSFDFYGTQNITFSCWIKMNALPSSSTYVMSPMCIQEVTQPLTNDKNIYVYGDGSVGFYVYDGASKIAKSSVSLVTTGIRYNLIGIFNGSSAKIYLNGLEVGTISASGSFNFTSPRFVMGHKKAATESIYFNGLIDEVIIENRAWSSTEVLNYYNQSKGVYAPKFNS